MSEIPLYPAASDEHEWAARILQLLDEHTPLSKDINRARDIESGSSLRGDDRTSEHLPLSYYVQYLLTAAADNFSAIRSMLILNETASNINLALHPFAPYTLVRNVIECAGTAYWVLSSSSRPTRVSRHAMLELEDARKSRSALAQFGKSTEETYVRRVELIKTMIGHYPNDIAWKSVTAGFTVTSALDEIGKASAFKEINPLGAWQLASGMAHGKRWAGLVLSDKEPFPNKVQGDTYTITGNYKHLWWLMNTANVVLAETHRLFVERGTAHHH